MNVLNDDRKKTVARAGRLKAVGAQIFASAAIGLILFMILQEVLQYAIGLDAADKFNSPLVLNLLAICAFPIVRRFMK